MDSTREDIEVPKRTEKLKRKTILSKLANANVDQLQLAKDLERQRLDSSNDATGLKNLKVNSGPSHHRDDKTSHSSPRRSSSRSDLEGKGGKRSRKFDWDSDSETEQSGYLASKRHSMSRLSTDDDEEDDLESNRARSLSSRRLRDPSKSVKNGSGRNVFVGSGRMNDDVEATTSSDAFRNKHREFRGSFRDDDGVKISDRRHDDDDDEDSNEKMDTVPELTRAQSGHNSGFHPIAAASTDFKMRQDFPPVSGLEAPFSDAGASDRSFASTGFLSLITTEKTRQRSFLVGSMSAVSSLLGSDTLERFFPERKMRIFVGTWNMCEMKTVPPVIDDFLLPELSEYVQDAYIIGTQETASNRYEWELKLQETLGPDYVMFHSSLYGTLHLAIFLRRDLIWFCSVSEEANVTTRPGPSSVKTKGAVAVCFTFFGTSFLFINSHFTAHDGRSQDRVEDFRKIISGLSLPKIVGNRTYGAVHDDVSSRFECVFWLGDLNTRLERDRVHLESVIASLQPDHAPRSRNLDVETEVTKCPETISYEELLQHDELKRLRDEALVFKNFQEGRIKFLPTYKYDIGTDNFDTSKKNRIPSYTDRILFRSRHKNGISCLLYQSAFQIRDSDHKPVYGLYEVLLRPGMDNIPLSGGQFNREVWVEGNKRRAVKMSQRTSSKSNSSVCSIM